jgi:hypothetical protein
MTTLVTGLVIFHWLILLIAMVGAAAVWMGALKGRKRLLKIYFWTIALIALSFVTTGACVITTLEKYLRRTYMPETAYTGGFISHYLEYLGIYIPDIASFWFLTFLLVAGVSGIFYHHINIRRIFARS